MIWPTLIKLSTGIILVIISIEIKMYVHKKDLYKNIIVPSNCHPHQIITQACRKVTEASGNRVRVTKVSDCSGKKEASEDRDQEVAMKIIDSKTKARSGVLIKHSDSNLM